MPKPLNKRQKKFAQLWAETGKPSAENAVAAGYAPTTCKHLMMNPRVRAYKDKLVERATEKASSEVGITRTKIMSEMWTLFTAHEDGKVRVKAGELLGKWLGMEVTLTADLTKEFEGKSDEELDHFARYGVWPDAPQSRPN